MCIADKNVAKCCEPVFKPSQGVVFELAAPELLALQRDAISLLGEVCVPENYCSEPIQELWREEERLRGWRSALTPKFSLGSTRKRLRGVPPHQHVLDHATFIVEHGFDTVFADCKHMKTINGTWLWCVKEKTLVKTADEVYTACQSFIESWEHNENQVIAQKSRAHPSLNLLEFETFGSLRAGVCLQLQRLLRAVGLRALSFERQGVIDLLQALLWQAGPTARASAEMLRTVTPSEAEQLKRLCALQGSEWLRLGHSFLEDEELCKNLCDECSNLLQHTKDNWCNHRTLLFIVLIGQCVAEHLPHVNLQGVARRAGTLLLEARQVGLRWLTEIQTTLVGIYEASQVQLLRRKLVDISSTVSLTFLPEGQAAITADSLEDWLRARASQYDNCLLGKEQITQMDLWRRRLFTQGMKAALRIEGQIHAVCSEGQGRAVSKFIKKHWSDCGHGSVGPWTQCSKPSEWWYEAQFSTNQASQPNILQLDVMRGSFLVDGAPVGRLPEKITSSHEYARLFKDMVFDVQPAHDGGFKTPWMMGACFKFQLRGDDVLISEERKMDQNQQVIISTLVPSKTFEGDLPHSLVHDHSHWLTENPPMVYFRPVFFQDPGFELGCTSEGSAYVLDLCTCRILENTTGFEMVDIQSETFDALFEAFGRLEERERIHIFHRREQVPLAILPRHGRVMPQTIYFQSQPL